MQILKRARQIKRCFSQKNLKTGFLTYFLQRRKFYQKKVFVVFWKCSKNQFDQSKKVDKTFIFF